MPQSDVFTFFSAVCLGSTIVGSSYFLIFVYSFPPFLVRRFFQEKIVESLWLRFDIFKLSMLSSKEVNFYYH